MKQVALILAMYIGLLSVMPCFDGFHSCEDHSDTEMTTEHQHHQHDHESEDGCTPFCACSCCGTLVLLSELKEQDYLTPKRATLNNEFHNLLHDQHFLTGVWHPPTIT